MSRVVLISNFETVKHWLLEYLNQNGVKKLAFSIDAKTPRLAANPSYVFTDKAVFESAGIEVVMIKLEDERNIRDTLSKCDAMYVKGGNSFYLLNAINNSDFRNAVNEMLAKGKMYIGESAGAYVACPTIEMAHWKHQDQDIVGLDNLTALGLVPFIVSAHYTDELRDVLESYVKRCGYEVELLRDNEVIIYEDKEASRFAVES